MHKHNLLQLPERQSLLRKMEAGSVEAQEAPYAERGAEVGAVQGGTTGCNVSPSMAMIELAQGRNLPCQKHKIYVHVCAGSPTLPCLNGLKSSLSGTTLAFLICLPKNGFGVADAWQQVKKCANSLPNHVLTDSGLGLGEAEARLALELLALGEFAPWIAVSGGNIAKIGSHWCKCTGFWIRTE